MAAAVNVDIDELGRVSRRSGRAKIYTGNVHSLWAGDVAGSPLCLFREGRALKRLDGNLSSAPPPAPTAVTIHDGIEGDRRMSYLALGGRVYYSDGVVTGVVEAGVRRSWGLAPPPAPVLSPYPGELPPGAYMVALTYVRGAGRTASTQMRSQASMESGAGPAAHAELPEGGGLAVSIRASKDPGVSAINVYVTLPNGEVFYRVMTLPNADAEVFYRGGAASGIGGGAALSTACLSPAPAGRLIEYFKGRVYVADGDVVWFSEPFGYELFDLTTGYVRLDGPLTLLAAVDDGLYAATGEKTYFLEPGAAGAALNLRQAASFGALFGTQAAGVIHSGSDGAPRRCVYWVAANGVCAGLDGGSIVDVTAGRFHFYTPGAAPGAANSGAGLFTRPNGAYRYITTLNI
jgi:hypothetical protein